MIVSKTLICLITYNSINSHSKEIVKEAIDSFTSLSKDKELIVIDNNSNDGIEKVVQGLRFIKNPINIGFSGAANQAALIAKKENFDYVLLVNPDLTISNECIDQLIKSSKKEKVFAVTPKIYRTGSENILDATGMILNSDLRHFDRHSNQKDSDNFNKEEVVFGGTGACLLLVVKYFDDLEINTRYEYLLEKICPGISLIPKLNLFDNAFIAYREDADLAYRAALFGFKTVYEPKANCFHYRAVLPENRSTVSKQINYFSVRNRFLIQTNNFKINHSFIAFIKGVLVRNTLIFFAVLLKERSSLKAFKDYFLLLKRSLYRRKIIAKRSVVGSETIIKNFIKIGDRYSK